MSLKIVGENRQEKNRVGVEVQSLQVVLAKDSKEELGKRRHQTGDDGAHKERIEGAPIALRLVGAGLEHSRPLVALRHHHQAREGEILLRHVWGIQSRRVPGLGWGLARRHGVPDGKD